ncbi:MAG: diphosphate--fructose-6-phosphate 1-phosphotransferase [Bacilli bacterium]|jgi:6-phosphofructokinase
MKKRSLAYLQSGGPTSVINTSLYGVIKEAKRHPDVIDGIYGCVYGVKGLINDHLIDLRAEDDETVELLKQTPGAALGTARYQLSNDFTHEDYQKIVNTLKKHNIGYLLINGGNDSMDTCHKLSQYFAKTNIDCAVIGIPKTIDNDLDFTDHCLGYPSAARYVVQSLQDIQVDNLSYRRGKIIVAEIMGRNAGWLTAAAALLPEELRPCKIYLPEDHFDLEVFLAEVKEIYENTGKAFIVVSEGVQAFLPGKNISVDAFNHMQLGGVANMLGEELEERFGFGVRPVEFSLMQRANPLNISEVDSKEAIRVSAKAVRSVIAGKSDAMVIIKRVSNNPYRSTLALKHLGKIANVEKKMSPELIADVHGKGILMREYLAPLIAKGIKLKYVDGRVAYAKLKKVRV